MNTFLTNQYQSFTDTLGKSSQEVQSLKGVPKKQTQFQGDLYYWYDSIVPSKAELYRFHEDKVVWTSLDVSSQELTFEALVNSFGKPEFSVYRYAEQEDSFQSKIAAWPTQGKAAIVSGSDSGAKVLRLEFFQPESVDEYLTNWGKDYADKEKINLLVTPTPYPPEATVSLAQSPSSSTSLFGNPQLSYPLLVLVLFLGFIILFVLLSWKRKKS